MAVSSMNVSAVAPEGYDVNNDGRVNIADNERLCRSKT